MFKRYHWEVGHIGAAAERAESYIWNLGTMMSEWDPAAEHNCDLFIQLGGWGMDLEAQSSFSCPLSLSPSRLPSLPSSLKLGLSAAPWTRGGGASESLQCFSFIFLWWALPCCQVSLIPERKWSSCFHPPRSWACKPTRCCVWFTKGLWGNWVCVLAVSGWSHSLDLLCTSYLFLKSIFSPLIIWNKVGSQETHQRSPKQGSHHPA